MVIQFQLQETTNGKPQIHPKKRKLSSKHSRKNSENQKNNNTYTIWGFSLPNNTMVWKYINNNSLRIKGDHARKLETQDTGKDEYRSDQNKRSTSTTCKSARNKRRYQERITRIMPSLRKLTQRRKLHQHRLPIPRNLQPIPRRTRLKSLVLSNNTLW